MAGFKRKLFYLGGFDPRGGRYYHALFAQELARAQGPAWLGDRQRRKGGCGWLAGDGAQPACLCDCTFLAWDDLVRRHWPRGLALGWGLWRAYGGFARHLRWGALHGARPAALIALLWPGLWLLLAPVEIGLAAAALVALGGVALGAAGGLLLALLWGRGLRQAQAPWLARWLIFNDRCARRLPADLDARLTLFAQAVEEALAQEAWDEVLLVAHSQGAVWAVEVLARVLARRGGALPAGFALVTLGGCIPLLAARRDAAGFAAALARVRAADPAWLDLASPADGACAGLMPPGSAPPPPRFTQRNPRWYRYAATRGGQDRLAVHFNYLRRLDRPSPLDYPALALAAQPLAASIAAFDAAHAG